MGCLGNIFRVDNEADISLPKFIWKFSLSYFYFAPHLRAKCLATFFAIISVTKNICACGQSCIVDVPQPSVIKIVRQKS